MNLFLVAHINALAGREAEFDEWYTHVHIRDVMRMRGAVAVQRFEAAPLPEGSRPRYRYFTLYDVADAAALSQGHSDAAGTPRLVFTPAADLSDPAVHYYEPLIELRRPAIDGPNVPAATIVEYFAEAGDEIVAGARDRMRDRFEKASAVRACLVRLLPYAQMFRRPAEWPLLALHQFVDAGKAVRAMRDWPADGQARCHYVKRTDPLTRDHVADADAEATAREESVRSRAQQQGGARWGARTA